MLLHSKKNIQGLVENLHAAQLKSYSGVAKTLVAVLLN